MSLRSLPSRVWQACGYVRQPSGNIRYLHPSVICRNNLSTIQSCPAPTCVCRDMPSGLDIDHTKPLDGTMAAYAEQLLISTGHSDWPSKVEDDESLPFLQKIKGYLGRNGKYSNPFHNVVVTASSFSLPATSTSSSPTVLLFPSFTQVTTSSYEPSTSDADAAADFIEGFVLPQQQSAQVTALNLPNSPVRDISKRARFTHSPIEDVVVLICGHGSRDSRCGIMGELLQSEFEEKLLDATLKPNNVKQPEHQVGLISHVGGHKFAGNVIIYIPPSLTSHPLAGKGIWYGRVEPRHVEGIVRSTIYDGKVIKEFFRGGVGQGGELLRL